MAITLEPIDDAHLQEMVNTVIKGSPTFSNDAEIIESYKSVMNRLINKFVLEQQLSVTLVGLLNDLREEKILMEGHENVPSYKEYIERYDEVERRFTETITINDQNKKKIKDKIKFLEENYKTNTGEDLSAEMLKKIKDALGEMYGGRKRKKSRTRRLRNTLRRNRRTHAVK